MSRSSRRYLLSLLWALALAVPRPAVAYEQLAARPPMPDTGCSACQTDLTGKITPAGGFEWPVLGKVVRRFGELDDGTRSDGLDIMAAEGTPVLAAQDGIVAYAGTDLRSYGNLLLIAHPQGFTTVYAHNHSILVRVGERVQRGQPVATIGHTGDVIEPVLHFQVRDGSQPIDPSLVLDRAETVLTAEVN